jgi:phospholipid/cholesterol/gamma-HCH transport system ATP-binding protein
VILLDDVHFSIGSQRIIRGISFEILAGETVAIIGASGSGKSTLLKLILGLYSPNSGKVLIDGIEISKMKEYKLRAVRKRIGMVFQDGALFDSLTVGENIGYYLLEHSKMKLKDIEEEVENMLEFIGLDSELRDRMPDELSGGMQRRVAIARALVSLKPKVMLYDEPTTGLDPVSTKRMTDIICKISEPHETAQVIVTHQIADAFRVADRFIMIDNGRKVFDGNGKSLLSSKDEDIISFLGPFNAVIARHCEMLAESNNIS